MNIKKLLTLLLVAALAVALFAGCGSSQEPQDTTAGTTASTEPSGEPVDEEENYDLPGQSPEPGRHRRKGASGCELRHQLQ